MRAPARRSRRAAGPARGRGRAAASARADHSPSVAVGNGRLPVAARYRVAPRPQMSAGAPTGPRRPGRTARAPCRSRCRPSARARRRLGRDRDAEVDQPGRRAHDRVGGLEVEMYDPLGREVVQCRAQLTEPVGRAARAAAVHGAGPGSRGAAPRGARARGGARTVQDRVEAPQDHRVVEPIEHRRLAGEAPRACARRRPGADARASRRRARAGARRKPDTPRSGARRRAGAARDGRGRSRRPRPAPSARRRSSRSGWSRSQLDQRRGGRSHRAPPAGVETVFG